MNVARLTRSCCLTLLLLLVVKPVSARRRATPHIDSISFKSTLLPESVLLAVTRPYLLSSKAEDDRGRELRRCCSSSSTIGSLRVHTSASLLSCPEEAEEPQLLLGSVMVTLATCPTAASISSSSDSVSDGAVVATFLSWSMTLPARGNTAATSCSFCVSPSSSCSSDIGFARSVCCTGGTCEQE
uniref:RxLR effector candidate protein n=1 Tax=Hyaloperonospora arabidopsidis (strain Emoy2) TaxID=559515 RepID=A0A090BF51_HYAAE|nr:RxLR effector candidate protein [Hyaloperonospora arabidopsidis Emoy2]